EEWRAARAQARQARNRLTAARSRAETAGAAEGEVAARLRSERTRLEAARAAHQEAVARLEAARLAQERSAGDVRRWADREHTGALHWASARAESVLARQEMEAAESQVSEMAASGAAADARLEAMEAENQAGLVAVADAERTRRE